MTDFNRNRRPGRSNFQRRDFDRNSNREDRQMHQAVCSNCGKNCQVPFLPSGNKPVYCSNCFEDVNKDSGNGRFERTDFRRPNFNENRRFDDTRNTPPQDTRQLEVINEKLDRILKLISSQAPVTKKEEKVAETPKSAKPRKTKKKTSSKKK